MSYILEALRRAERERAQGQAVPAGDAPPAPDGNAANRSTLLKVLIAALALNAIIVSAILMRPGAKPATDAVAGPGLAAPTVAPLTGPPASTITTSPALIEAAPAPIDKAVVQQGVASMDDLGARGEPEDTPPLPKTTMAPPPARPSGRVTYAKKPLTPQVPRPEPAPQELDPALPSPAPAQPALTPVAFKPLSDMSAAYQGSFPQFTMEVHVYDAAPQRRFALIGGQRYHEGDALPQGARLLQIVPNGLVVEFRSEKVLYPIGRH